MKHVSMKSSRTRKIYALAATAMLLLRSASVIAQDASAGLNEANTQIRGYYTIAVDLVYALGAIIGLVGAVKVYQKWISGDGDTGKVASAWFGGCVFLVLVATIIKSFFGV